MSEKRSIVKFVTEYEGVGGIKLDAARAYRWADSLLNDGKNVLALGGVFRPPSSPPPSPGRPLEADSDIPSPSK